MKAIFYSHANELGSLELKIIDQSMGVVGGLLSPTETYLKLQHIFRKSKGAFTADLEKLELNIQLENGCLLYPSGAFSIYDMEEAPEEITVDVTGLHYDVVNDFFVADPPKPFLTEPWYPLSVERKFTLEAELNREIGKDGFKVKVLKHPLSGSKCYAVAKHGPSDDVLFYVISKNSCSFVVVHLTWGESIDKTGEYPTTEFYEDFEEFRVTRMEPESLDWE